MARDTNSCFERTYNATHALCAGSGDLRERLSTAETIFMPLRVEDFPVELRDKVSRLHEELSRACKNDSTREDQTQAAKSMLSVYTQVARLEGTFADSV